MDDTLAGGGIALTLSADQREKRVRALMILAAQRAKFDTATKGGRARHVETLACGMIRDNLAYILGEPVIDPDLVMPDDRVEKLLADPEGLA